MKKESMGKLTGYEYTNKLKVGVSKRNLIRPFIKEVKQTLLAIEQATSNYHTYVEREREAIPRVQEEV